MSRRRTLMALAVAVLLLQFSDCMASLVPDQKMMECCATMSCSMEHMGAGCCQTTVSVLAPSSLPASKILVDARALHIVFQSSALEPAWLLTAPPRLAEARQSSPPHLYTLHHAFLI
jgi:hypothetical protein